MTGRRRVSTPGLLILSVWLLSDLLCQVHAQQKVACATKCLELNCDNANIRYGKYCGVGHGGCEGEKPCDAADACCRRHDMCVESTGLLGAQPCHTKFLRCLAKVEASGRTGFSKQCPYDVVIPTMRNGIQLALALTSMFGGTANIGSDVAGRGAQSRGVEARRVDHSEL